MAIVVASWSAILVVLVVGALRIRRELEEYRRLRAMHFSNPILEIKRRFDAGEISRTEFEREIRVELERKAS